MRRLFAAFMVAALMVPALCNAQARIGATWEIINVFNVTRSTVTLQDTVCGYRCAGAGAVATGQPGVLSQNFMLAGASDVFVIVTDSTGTGTITCSLIAAADTSFGSTVASNAWSDSVIATDTLTCNPRIGACAQARTAASAKNPLVIKFSAMGAQQQQVAANGANVDGYTARNNTIGAPWGKIHVTAAGTALARCTIRLLILYPYGKPALSVVQGSGS